MEIDALALNLQLILRSQVFFPKCIFFRIHADGTDMAFNNQSPFCLILSETATTVQDQLDLIRTQDTA